MNEYTETFCGLLTDVIPEKHIFQPAEIIPAGVPVSQIVQTLINTGRLR